MRRPTWHRNGLWLLLIVSLAFNAGFGTTFGVRTYRRHCGGGAGEPGTAYRGLAESLNLTPEQAAQMKAAKEELLRQVDAVRQELTVERDALAELLAAAEPDRAEIAARLERIGALRQRVQRTVVDHILHEKGLLNPEQASAYSETIRWCICPHGGRGPESTPGACRIRDGSEPANGDGCPGMDRP